MTAKRVLTCVLLAGLLATAAVAQDPYAPPPPPPSDRPPPPPAGFWPTPRMMELIIDRMTEGMVRQFQLDEEQLQNIRVLFKDRFPTWLQENRPEIQQLMNEYLEAVMSEQPPSPEQAAEWAARAQPLINEFVDLSENTLEEMGGFLDEEQNTILNGQRAVMRVMVNHLNDRLDTWKQGGYDYRTDWPHSPEFQQHEQERIDQLQTEALMAKNRAMGIELDSSQAAIEHGDAAAGGGAAGPGGESGQRPAPQPGAAPAAPKDEWAQYVENFIQRYKLNDAQQSSAQRFLRSAQEQREKYISRHATDIDALDKRLSAAREEGERAKIKEDYHRLNQPLDRMFERLKEQLDRLPTRKQRADAMKGQMDQQTGAGAKPAAKKPAETPPKPGE